MSSSLAKHPNPLAGDLDYVLERTGPLWDEVRGARLFVTGGTGFVGRWMLESMVWANDELDLGIEAVVLSRSPSRFVKDVPHLGIHDAITMLEGDIRSVVFPGGDFSHVLHLATETNRQLSAPEPTAEFETAVHGTQRVLEFAADRRVRGLLYTSSGAVYGRQPAECVGVSEDSAMAPPPQDTEAAYAHGKRAAEFLCCAAHKEAGVRAKIARLFAFVGPYLSLDSGFAVGNFIRDVMRDEPIRISGDGTPERSYLYAADLAWWLWTILMRGDAGRPYNVGSDADLSILDLAGTVARVLDSRHGVVVAQPRVDGSPVHRYVPDISRATSELELRASVSLEDGIRRTAEWHEKTRPTNGKACE